MRTIVFLFLYLSLLLTGFNSPAQSLTRKVLFLGNSYTYVNDLPQLTSDVANSVGDSLLFDSNTPGGYTLEQHATNPTSLAKIMAGGWDYVILQEQSQLPSFPDYYQLGIPALCDTIKQYNPCARKMFYMTWGRKNGDASNCAAWPPVCTYEGMDSLLRLRYLEAAQLFETEVSPVGAVWHYIRQHFPGIDLYQPDESHPSTAGSYAAACCFYAALFKKDPSLITYDYVLNPADAASIRAAAKAIVYDSLPNWDFGNYLPAADFSFRIGAGINEVRFHNKSENATSFSWDFGDTNTSTTADPIHNYAADGIYTVTLSALRCDIDQVNQSTHSVNISFCAHNPTVSPDSLISCPNSADTLFTQAYDSYQWLDGNGQVIPNETNPFILPSGEAYYSVMTTLNNCWEISPPAYVEYFTPGFVIYRVDTISNSVNPGTLCNGDTLLLVLNTNKPAGNTTHIQWFVNGASILQANDDTLLVLASGSFHVSVIDTVCPNYVVYESQPESFTFINCNAGIEGSNAGQIIVVNPARDENFLRVIAPPSCIGQDYLITDLLGSVLCSGNLENEINLLPLDALRTGVYFIRFDPALPVTVKFIKY